MKCLLLLLLALFGDSALAADPNVTLQLRNTDQPIQNVFASVIQSKSQIVESLTLNLRGVMQTLRTDVHRFNNYSATYTPSVTVILPELRRLIMSAEDNVFYAIIPVYEWCGTLIELTAAYQTLFQLNDRESVRARNDIIQHLLSDDFTSPLKGKLGQLSNDLHEASRLVSSILIQFDSDFTDQSTLFKTLLRDEVVKQENFFYKHLFRAVLNFFKRNLNKPQQLRQENSSTEGTINMTETILAQQPSDKPVAAVPGSYYQQHNELAKNRILSQFERTRTFFKSFEQQLEDMISRVNRVIAKILEENWLGQNLQVTGNAEADSNAWKSAAQTLITKCTNLSVKL